MSSAAILGAGPLGSALAHAFARRSRFREIRLVDDASNVAAGKALDIQQSGPIERFDTSLTATSDVLSAAGADVIIVADAVEGGEWTGDRGLALLERLVRAGTKAPIVFAGPGQAALLESVSKSLGVPGDRLIATAVTALAGAARALIGIEVNGSSTDAHVTIAGRPGALVVLWSSATVGGLARRRPHSCASVVGDFKDAQEPGAAGSAGDRGGHRTSRGKPQLRPARNASSRDDARWRTRRSRRRRDAPVELGDGRVLRRIVPSMSPQERTEIVTESNGSNRRTRQLLVVSCKLLVANTRRVAGPSTVHARLVAPFRHEIQIVIVNIELVVARS